MNVTSSTDPALFLVHTSSGMAVLPGSPRPDAGDPLLNNDTLPRRNGSLTGFRNVTMAYDPLGGHAIWQVVLIVFFTGSLSLVTVVGNILVLLSFKVNKALKTVNNYYLLSLAFADLIIGVLSMNLYTTYIIMNQWALGNWACDLWLAIDYVASNASVMNLLVISFDRYFSVTRPLTYRVKRTTKRAMTMIGLAWSISFVLWAPAILFWQYIVGERTVPLGQCFIQFLSEPIITFCTAIAAFYLPVTIMTVLYWKIYKETENRSKDLAGLRGSGNQGKEDEATAMMPQTGSSRSCSSYELNQPPQKRSGKKSRGWFRFWPLGNRLQRGNSGRDQEHSSSDSWNNNETGVSMDQSDEDEEETQESRTIYSIVVNLPPDKPEPLRPNALHSGVGPRDKTPTKIFSQTPVQSMSSIAEATMSPASSGTTTKAPLAPISFKDAAIAKRFASKAKTQINKRKKQSLVKEKKAAQTLSAILFAFIITWTPYNIMVLVNTFCNDCIPATLWALGYWLCYVNSTVNPMCYALCNKTFRDTFRMILLCQWKQKKLQKPHFQQRQAVAFHKKEPL
ncbi:muscarinic acetylcholine receptor M3 isoform X2 [Denticeps clupeoides]|nr:muscarinic acetylcholine receptor M3 isoform X2 [Denticeps clupeoides]XP_028823143.1 muscarinic acetylcholine receptor M3 isoform X2 [Denticeps clupeoides]